jgi:hypothetical protein
MQPSFSIFRPAILVTLTAIAAADGQPWKFSFDGNARTVVETYRNLYFDLSGDGDDGWVHQRVQAMLALEHENTFQLAAELSFLVVGRLKCRGMPPLRTAATTKRFTQRPVSPSGHRMERALLQKAETFRRLPTR